MTSEEFGKQIDKTIFPGLQGGPLMHVIAGKAVAFGEALSPDYRAYTKQVIENAMAMSDTFVERGMKVISGGTDTHLLLLDVDSIGMSGKQAEKALDKVGITVNKNTIPGDPRPPTQASGIRIGSPAVTTRGFGVDESRWIANLIADVLQQPDDEALLERAQRGGALRSRASFRFQGCLSLSIWSLPDVRIEEGRRPMSHAQIAVLLFVVRCPPLRPSRLAIDSDRSSARHRQPIWRARPAHWRHSGRDRVLVRHRAELRASD